MVDVISPTTRELVMHGLLSARADLVSFVTSCEDAGLAIPDSVRQAVRLVERAIARRVV
jgi:hypothetical protein